MEENKTPTLARRQGSSTARSQGGAPAGKLLDRAVQCGEGEHVTRTPPAPPSRHIRSCTKRGGHVHQFVFRRVEVLADGLDLLGLGENVSASSWWPLFGRRWMRRGSSHSFQLLDQPAAGLLPKRGQPFDYAVAFGDFENALPAFPIIAEPGARFA